VRLLPSLYETSSPEKGRAAGGGTGRSWGVGKFRKDPVEPRYRTRSEGPVKLKKTRTAKTEIQIAVIIGGPGRREWALREARE